MGRIEVDNWVNKKIRDKNGVWAQDTMQQILRYMDERPITGTRGRADANEEYWRLVEVACEYLQNTRNLAETFDLVWRVIRDLGYIYCGEKEIEKLTLSPSLDRLRILLAGEQWIE